MRIEGTFAVESLFKLDPPFCFGAVHFEHGYSHEENDYSSNQTEYSYRQQRSDQSFDERDAIGIAPS